MVKFEESFEIRVTLLLDMTNFLNKSSALVTVRQKQRTHFMGKTHVRQTFLHFSSYLDTLICKDFYHNLCYNYYNSLKLYYVI